MKINEAIKAARIEHNITQKELAEKIEVRKATISEFESGKHALGSDKLEAIMNELGLTISKQHDCIPVLVDFGYKPVTEQFL